MAGTLAPDVFQQFLDANGNPYASYKLFAYLAGTTTKVDTHSDVNLTVVNPNPLTLDAAGRPSSGGNVVPLFLTPGVSYKFVIALPTDTDPPTSPVLTQDNVAAVPASGVDLDVVASAGEVLAATDAVYLSTGQGGKTAGKWYKMDADNAYASSQAEVVGFPTAAILANATGTVRIAGRPTWLSGLVAGGVYYASATDGALTLTAPANKRVIGVADSTSAIILNPDQALRLKSVVAKTSNYTATVGDDVISGTGTWTLTLYAASGNSGRQLILKNAGTGIITVDGNASELVGAAVTFPVFPGETVTLFCDGTNWITILHGVRVLDRDVTEQAVTNSGASTTVYTVTMPANTLGSRGTLRLTVIGEYFNNTAGAQNLTLALNFGGSTVFTTTQAITNNASARALRFVAEIMAANATNAQRANSVLTVGGAGSSAGSGQTITSTIMAEHDALAVDVTAAQVVEVVIQHGAADANLTFTMRNARLELTG